jgi:peroxiredoxin/outer membrane lipoprotein-sorting protein
MFKRIVTGVCALLAVLCGLVQADSLTAAAICGKVAETYKNLSMYQFTAQFHTDYAVQGAALSSESYYALAVVKPAKVRFTKKEKDRELIIVSDGETTWKYLPGTKQYTKESVATLEDDDQTEQPSRGEIDPLTDVQNKLVNRYAGLIRYAPLAVLAKDDRLKIEGDKLDCYVLQIRLPQGAQELWVDKNRFLVLRHMETAKGERNGVPIGVKVTLNFKQADIATVPENDLFAFPPPEKSVEVQTLNLPGERPNLTGRVAQDFTLKTLDGAKITLSELHGKVVLLDFWATWCPPCRKEMPNIERLYREYKDKGLVVLGINGEDSGTVKGFLKKNEYSLPVLMDAKRDVHRMYGARAIPTVIVINRDGVIKAHYIGGRSGEELMAAVRTAGIE